VAPIQDDSELVTHLKRKITDQSIEMERLRNEMIAMARVMDQKEDRVRHLENRINSSPPRPAPCTKPSELEHMLRKENETIK